MTARVLHLEPARTATPRQLGPKQANALAERARLAKLLSGASVHLFEYLLRRARPEKAYAVQVRHRELCEALHCSERTLRYAVRQLEASGLVVVTLGHAGRSAGAASGRTWTTYELNRREILGCLGEPPGSPWGGWTVNPGEFTSEEGGNNCPLSGQELPPKGAISAAPNVRAREESPLKENPPYPRDPAAGPRPDSPPASGRGPLSDFERCEHGRTPAQGGCRICGTTRRQRAELEAARQRAERDRARVAEQLRERAEREAARAAAAPPDPDVIKAARAAAQAGKRAPK